MSPNRRSPNDKELDDLHRSPSEESSSEDLRFMIRQTYRDMKTVKEAVNHLSTQREDHNIRLIKLEEAGRIRSWWVKTAAAAAISALVASLYNTLAPHNNPPNPHP